MAKGYQMIESCNSSFNFIPYGKIFLSDDPVRKHHPLASVGGKTDPLEPRHARDQLLLQHHHLCLSGLILQYIHCDLCLSVVIRPRYTWGPSYGSECLKHTDVVETQ